MSVWSPDRVLKKSEQKYEIQSTIDNVGSSCSGSCELGVWIKDKNGYTSDRKYVAVEFKE